MKITKKWLTKHYACQSAINKFTVRYKSIDVVELLQIKRNGK